MMADQISADKSDRRFFSTGFRLLLAIGFSIFFAAAIIGQIIGHFRFGLLIGLIVSSVVVVVTEFIGAFRLIYIEHWHRSG